jgi:hypothetical protein
MKSPKMTRLIVFTLLAGLATPSAPTCASAEAPHLVQVPLDEKAATMGRWPLVDVNLLFLDPRNQAVVPNATPAFRVQEDGVERSVKTVSGLKSPVSVCIFIRFNGGAHRFWNDLRSAVAALVMGLPTGSEVLIVYSADNPYIAVPFSSALGAINTLPNPENLAPITPNPSLLDSILTTEMYFAHRAKYHRRAFVLFTSGLSDEKPDSTVRAMLFPGAPFFYVVRTRAGVARRFEPEEQISRNRIRDFARQLGGRCLMLSPGETDTEDKAREIASDISSQYALTYTSGTKAGSEKLHRVSIQVPAAAQIITVQSTPGYYLTTP